MRLRLNLLIKSYESPTDFRTAITSLNSGKILHPIVDPGFELSGINLVFLELAKRKKLGNFNFDDPVDRWLSLLVESEKLLTMPKFDLSVYPNLLKAAELLDDVNYTQEQLNAYDRHLLAVYDINMSRIESFDEGFEVGVQRGIEKGLKQAREEGIKEGFYFYLPIIKEFQRGELTHEEIADKFSISLEAVNKLAEELK